MSRTGVYVAFNGCGTTDPTESDIKCYNLLKAWNENKAIDFSFPDSHAKTYAVRDSSSIDTLHDRLRERLRKSKIMLLIITQNTTKTPSVLDWEISEAVYTYKLPIVVAYTFHEGYLPNPSLYRNKWPAALKDAINTKSVKSIHIPFQKKPIIDAISKYGVNNPFTWEIAVYSKEYYDNIST